MTKRDPRLAALKATIRTSARELKSRTQTMVKVFEADDPFRGLGDFELTRATVIRGITKLAGVKITRKYTEPKPKPAAKKKAKAQPKKTTKKRVAKQLKQPATPAIEVLFQSPEGNKHWLPLVPENSELLLIGWTIIDADDMSAVNAMYGEAM